MPQRSEKHAAPPAPRRGELARPLDRVRVCLGAGALLLAAVPAAAQESLTLSFDTGLWEGGPDARLTAVLDAPAPTGGTQVTLTVDSGSTATRGVDYTLSGTTMTINAGSTTSTEIILSVIDDAVADDWEVIYLFLSSTNPTLSSAGTGLYITDENGGGDGTDDGDDDTDDGDDDTDDGDDDTVPAARLSASPNPVDEGEPATVTAHLSSALSNAVTIPLTLTAGTTEPGDYGALSGITISAGQTTGTGTVTTADDTDEDDETFTVALGTLPSAVTAGSPDSVTVTIRDTTPPNRAPVVSASCDPCVVQPGGQVRLTATASDADGDPLTYVWKAPQGSFAGTADGASARWRAPGEPGRVALRVEVSDGRGGMASAVVSVEVNAAPTVSVSCDPCVVQPGSEVVLTATGSDADGDPLTYSWSAPRGSFAGAADESTARWRAPGEPGRVAVRVEVSDGRGGMASAVVSVEVNAVPTVSASCDPCVIQPGGEVILTATGSDPDGDPLTYSWSAPRGSLIGAADAAAARWRAPGETGRVTLRVEVSDGRGGTASAEVAVEVTNAPPAFDEPSYTFELRENVDGRPRPVALGAVAAGDPDGDEVTYALASGAAARFAVGAEGGAVTYVGPGEDFETEPNRYDLTVRVRDPYGAEALAQIVVEVTNVNEPPAAEDDEAATDEDARVVVDVLANDTDPDGDGLRVASVSAPAHGTARVVSGGVAYTPEADYHGTDRFTYVASDGNGGTAGAAVVVTVAPVNDTPSAVGAMPDQALDEGGSALDVDVAPYFEDVDRDALAYRASSSDPRIVLAAVSGSMLTLTPVEYGSAAVTVTAEDAGGLTAVQTFAVGVSDRPVREVVWHTLAGMARSHLASARMTLGRRASASGAAGGSRLTVLGRSAPLDEASAQSAAQALAGWAAGAGGHGAWLGRPGLGSPAGYGASGPGGALSPASLPGMAIGANGVGRGAGLGGFTPGGSGPAGGLGGLAPAGAHGLVGLGGVGGFGTDPLRGSEFQLALGGDDETAGVAAPGRRWLVWGQGDVQTFAGAPSAAAGYEGDLRTGYVGVDTALSARWLAGVAVSRSRGGGDWQTGSARGSLSTTLTAAYPYVQWSAGRSSVWAAAGGGRGTAENVRETGRVGTSDLGLRLGLVEVRRGLDPVGGVELGVRADAAWAQLGTGAGEETLDRQTAAVGQVRAGAEVSRPVRWDNGLSLSPFGELHVRRDGGAGQTGTGVEVVAGTRVARGRLRVDAQGRLLVLHSASGYRERGAGVTLSVGRRDRQGLSLSVSPSWGDAAAGGETLWQEQVYRRYLPEAMEDAWGLNARGEYGTRLPSGGLLTWFGSLSQSAYGPRFLVGGRVDATAGTSNGGAGRTGIGPAVAAGTRATAPRLARRDPPPSGSPVRAAPKSRMHAAPDSRVHAAPDSRVHVALDNRVHAAAASAAAMATGHAVAAPVGPGRAPRPTPAVEHAPAARCSSGTDRTPGVRRVGRYARGPGDAVTDVARTYADLPVLIDVLANDVNPDGLRIVDVTTPKHGTTTICDGLVRYAPAPRYRGRDAFNYAVVLEDGRTARASVTVMVLERDRSTP